MISPKKVPKCAAGWLWLSHLLQQLHSFLTFLDRWDTQLKIKMGPFDWAQQMLLVYWVEVDTVCSATRVIKSRATMLIRVPLSLCLPSFEYQLKYQSENLHVHQNQSRRGRGRIDGAAFRMWLLLCGSSQLAHGGLARSPQLRTRTVCSILNSLIYFYFWKKIIMRARGSNQYLWSV